MRIRSKKDGGAIRKTVREFILAGAGMRIRSKRKRAAIRRNVRKCNLAGSRMRIGSMRKCSIIRKIEASSPGAFFTGRNLGKASEKVSQSTKKTVNLI